MIILKSFTNFIFAIFTQRNIQRYAVNAHTHTHTNTNTNAHFIIYSYIHMHKHTCYIRMYTSTPIHIHYTHKAQSRNTQTSIFARAFTQIKHMFVHACRLTRLFLSVRARMCASANE